MGKWFTGLFFLYPRQWGNLMLLLLGGNKNSQSTDIVEAKNIVFKAVGKIEEKKKIGTKKKASKKKGKVI